MSVRVAIGVLLALTFATPASAHNSHGWFWSEGLAQARYRAHYGVYSVDCRGIGQHIRRYNEASARWSSLYRHFDCFDTTTQGEDEEVILHVKGRFAFSVYNV